MDPEAETDRCVGVKTVFKRKAPQVKNKQRPARQVGKLQWQGNAHTRGKNRNSGDEAARYMVQQDRIIWQGSRVKTRGFMEVVMSEALQRGKNKEVRKIETRQKHTRHRAITVHPLKRCHLAANKASWGTENNSLVTD